MATAVHPGIPCDLLPSTSPTAVVKRRLNHFIDNWSAKNLLHQLNQFSEIKPDFSSHQEDDCVATSYALCALIIGEKHAGRLLTRHGAPSRLTYSTSTGPLRRDFVVLDLFKSFVLQEVQKHLYKPLSTQSEESRLFYDCSVEALAKMPSSIQRQLNLAFSQLPSQRIPSGKELHRAFAKVHCNFNTEIVQELRNKTLDNAKFVCESVGFLYLLSIYDSNHALHMWLVWQHFDEKTGKAAYQLLQSYRSGYTVKEYFSKKPPLDHSNYFNYLDNLQRLLTIRKLSDIERKGLHRSCFNISQDIVLATPCHYSLENPMEPSYHDNSLNGVNFCFSIAEVKE